MKYFLKRDTLFATIGIFILIWLISLIPLNTHFFNPFKTAFADFDFLDIAYSQMGKNDNSKLDNRIILVNIGNANRAEIAGILQRLKAASPRTIGLDVTFAAPKDSLSDRLLAQTIASMPNLVSVCYLKWEEELPELKKGYFTPYAAHLGYGNFIGEDNGCIRYFSPKEKGTDQTFESFTTALLKQYSPEAYSKLLKRNKEVERINYSRKVDKYLQVEGYDLLTDNVADTLFHNKIVLVGYLNDNPNDIEDKHFTPFNKKFAGRSTPDMNGLVIHANILSMELDNNYINKIPDWLNWLITIIIAWIHMALFIRYYIDNHIWFHLVAKILQIVSAIFFIYLSIQLFDKQSVRFDSKLSIVVIILAVDVIYFYEALAIWLHKKFHYKTIFHANHH
jgi:CHASE2 domain-containing sensor protein